jgi:hypothetical protein
VMLPRGTILLATLKLPLAWMAEPSSMSASAEVIASAGHCAWPSTDKRLASIAAFPMFVPVR